LIDKTILNFKILEKIGEGGMGVVYKAEDTKLKRLVAVKFLTQDIAGRDKESERFKIEAQATAALNHRNIVTIYEIDEAADDIFIVMEYIDGQQLKEIIANGQLNLKETFSIATQIADGLQAAHKQGIVHRDIKSTNIMVTPTGQVKITDFGLAKFLKRTSVITNGVSLGTITYMSPEQVQGVAVDHRTDIWSFGVLLYEMVTGQLPFKGDYELTVVYSVINEKPEAVTILRPEIPTELENIINKALSKDPTKRYFHTKDLLDDLNVLKKMYLSESKIEPVIKEKPAPSIVVLPFLDLSAQKDQEYFCDGLTEELIDALAGVKGWRVVSRTSAFAFKGKDQDIRQIGKQLNVSHVLEGSVRKSENRLRITAQLINVEDGFHLWSEKYDRELVDVFVIQDDIAGSILKKMKMKFVDNHEAQLVKRYTENLKAYNLYLQARYHLNKRTAEGLRKGVGYCEQAIEIDPDYALAYTGLSDGFILQGFQGFLPPKVVMPKAKTAAKKALEIDNALAEAHTSLGCLRAVYDWEWCESEKEFKQAIELKQNNATAHHWYVMWCLLPMGQFDLALSQLKQAQELDPLSLVISTAIGWQFFLSREYDRAIEEFTKTLEMDPDFVVAHDLIGQTFEQKGDYDRACTALKKAVALSGKRTLSLGALGHAYASSGKKNKAYRILNDLIKTAKQTYISSYDIALIYTGLGKKDEAFIWLEKTYNERNGWLGFLNVEPRMDSLRSDTRFAELLKRVKLR